MARSGLAIHSAYPSARLTLGRALLDSGDATSARAELESAVHDAPDNIEASRYLAQAREQLGDLKGAADQYRKTLLMAPDDRQLQAALAAVEARLALPAVTWRSRPTPRRHRHGAPRPAAGTAGGCAADAGRGTLAAAPSVTATPPSPFGRGPARGLRAVETAGRAGAGVRDRLLERGGPLPATLRIDAPQTGGAPAPAPVLPAPAPAPVPPEPTPPVAVAEPRTLPGMRAEAPAAEAASEAPGGATAPFSSSTLRKLYFQQVLIAPATVDRAACSSSSRRTRRPASAPASRSSPAPVADERAARRRALQRRTIVGLEALLEPFEGDGAGLRPGARACRGQVRPRPSC